MQKKRLGLKTVCPICDYQFKSKYPSEEEKRVQAKKARSSTNEIDEFPVWIKSKSNQKRQSIPQYNQPKSSEEKLNNAKELQHKRLGSNSHYKRCPSCNNLVNKHNDSCKYCNHKFKTNFAVNNQSPNTNYSNKEKNVDSKKSVFHYIKCPNCDNEIPKNAIRCKYCNHYFKTWKKIDDETKEEIKLKQLKYDKFETLFKKSVIHTDVLIDRVCDYNCIDLNSRFDKINFLIDNYSFEELKIIVDETEKNIINEKVKKSNEIVRKNSYYHNDIKEDKLDYAKELQHKRLGSNSHYKRCPSCKKLINKNSDSCKYCKVKFDDASIHNIKNINYERHFKKMEQENKKKKEFLSKISFNDLSAEFEHQIKIYNDASSFNISKKEDLINYFIDNYTLKELKEIFD